MTNSMPEWMNQVADDLYCVDCDYIQPRLACAYIMINGAGRAAFIETNTSLAAPRLLQALEMIGLQPEQVDWIIPTHVHLDHAGGAGALLEKCSNARVLAHPRAAKHLIDPARLIESSIQVYGKELFEQLYGEIVPCPEERVLIQGDDSELEWGNRTFHFLHTRGHANHHFCIFEKESNGIFTGDSFGLAYPDLQGSSPFIIASSTPTDFDPTAALESVERILKTGARYAFLTHFSKIDWMGPASEQLKESLHFLGGLLDESINRLTTGEERSELESEVKTRMLDRWCDILQEKGFADRGFLQKRLEMDAGLNAAGILFAAGRAASKR